jgi:hypothetical protein
MSSVAAFFGTVAIVVAVQSARWWIAGKRGGAVPWSTYMRSPQAWIGWPLAFVAGTYILVLLASLAATN